MDEHTLKFAHLLVLGRREWNARTWIKGNQVHFAADSAHQLEQLARASGFIIHAPQQNILKSNALPAA